MQPFQDAQLAMPGGQDHGVRGAALSICGKTNNQPWTGGGTGQVVRVARVTTIAHRDVPSRYIAPTSVVVTPPKTQRKVALEVFCCTDWSQFFPPLHVFLHS